MRFGKEQWKKIGKSSIRVAIVSAVASYLILFAVALLLANPIIYHPPTPASYHDDKSSIKITTADGVRITARYYPNASARFTILYSHGNGEDLGKDTTLHEGLVAAGFSVLAYDYHGYGTSEGKVGERETYLDVDAAYRYLTDTLHIPADRIIIFGRSLGGGPSIDLAARKPAAGLVLESTFSSAFMVATVVPLLPFDKYRNEEKLAHVRCPVLVIHGLKDATILPLHGKRLYDTAHTPKQYLWVDGATHDNLPEIAGDKYRLTLQRFAASLAKTHR